MKQFKYIALAAIALLVSSCYEADKMKAAPADTIGAPMLNDHSDVVVDEDNLKTDLTFSWSPVDYGYPAAVSYSLYATYGDSEPYQIGEAYATSFTITKENFNNILVAKKGLAVPELETSTIYLFVTSAISPGNDSYTKQSNTIMLQVSTIESTAAAWIRRPLYVAGNYQGWEPAKAPILWETEEFSDVYEGLVYLGDAANTGNYDQNDGLCHFKFCPNPDWNGNLGGDENALTNVGDPAHITRPDGLYWIEVELTPDHSTGTVKISEVSKIGVIGAAVGGWGDTDDVVMSLVGVPTDTASPTFSTDYYAAMCGQTWEGYCATTIADIFKYRLNGNWDDPNWGESLEHLKRGGKDLQCTLTGNVRFTINFRGDVDALAEDETNPSPISGTVTQVE